MYLLARAVSLVVLFLFLLVTVSRAQDQDGPVNAAATMGERLFLETRFAQFFFTNLGGDANARLAEGDPVMNATQTIHGPQPGPFAGQSMNCRACHLVDEFNGSLGNRTYCDFTQRSPIPRIGDGRTHTPRNSPTLVNALLPRATPLLLHFDGQFASAQDLIIGTLTGRNYGWQPREYATALAHIAHVIRADDGSGALAQGKFGGGYSYAQVLSPSADVEVNKLYRLNVDFTLGDLGLTDPNDPFYVTDEEIVQDVAALIQAYLETLVFSQDADGNFNGSPYDVFLLKNGLPPAPGPQETPLQYSQRLLAQVERLANPQYVSDPADGHFTTHTQPFRFGPRELEGLKIFFNRDEKRPRNEGRTGNCVACHAPPAFTDFIFHNTGAAQEEYDDIHGPGSFDRLVVPDYTARLRNYDAYLPPTPNHPDATGRFARAPVRNQPGQVDLGVWNIFANPDFPAPQAGLQAVLPELTGHAASPAFALPHAIALFKTPTVRDLGHSEPYLHTGRMNTIEDVVDFYHEFSRKARAGVVRNSDPNLRAMSLDKAALGPLAAFLRALNEDYTD